MPDIKQDRIERAMAEEKQRCLDEGLDEVRDADQIQTRVQAARDKEIERLKMPRHRGVF